MASTNGTIESRNQNTLPTSAARSNAQSAYPVIATPDVTART